MTTARREALVDRLSQVLGSDEAETLMTYLPGGTPATQDEVLANGRRLDAVEGRLDGVERRLDGVDSRLDRVEHRLDSLYELVVRQTTELTKAISDQTRTFVLSTTASVISAAGLAFAAARFI